MRDFIFCLSIKHNPFRMPMLHPSWLLCGARNYSTSWPEANKNIWPEAEIVKNNWLHYFLKPVNDSGASGIAGLKKPSSYKASNDLIWPEAEKTLANFWNSVMNKLDNNQFVLILFRIKYLDYNIATLGGGARNK